jgi:hypothetical protein
MNTKKAIVWLLLGFVMFGVCFVATRQTVLRMRKQQPQSHASGGPLDRAIIYYVHPTIRCVTCNKIQAMTQELVHSQFGPQLQAGLLQVRQADFQQDEALARRYNISASTVVVVAIRGGKEAGFQRLDDVWTLVDKPEEFGKYVAGAIAAALPAAR